MDDYKTRAISIAYLRTLQNDYRRIRVRLIGILRMLLSTKKITNHVN